ncbi:BTAD domain-containing putative transcriptional regulator [Kutzneria sp. 744]|uniref:AfsR/SARP family transcriptional regulator n=1 Tax=Kutzneria sp. (strain 744) TaxID=345341 RepID=UPI0004AE07F4|nr:BTAD domain-containing putative transcriptional regulator [Kutzneria sp. 744]
MQIRVLGQFEVTRGEERITPSQPKLRQLFALLALNTNTVVRVEQLIEEVWGSEPPTKAMGTLQTYMSHLRRLLAADDSTVSVLHTRHVGYALTLPEQDVDAGRFGRLVARGRSELDSGHIESAAETLRAALAVWRGSALSDVDAGPVLGHHIRSLEETKVGVIDQRMEVELMLGHHHEVINDLSTLVRDYPAHEGLHVKLMMALHLLGRRSEALHVFQRIRSTLVDDLGLEPGQQLQQVHRGLLVGNPQLDALTPTGAIRTGSWVEPPAQLPADLPVFVGRTVELAAAESQLQQPARSAPAVVSVVGPPGSGKTAFCTHLAHRVRARFPHGQLHADLAEQTPVEALTGFLRAIRGAGAQLPDSIEERSHLLRGWTAERRVLIMIDNAVSTIELAPLMPSGGGCAVIVGCRTRLPLRGTSLAVDLQPPAEDEALELLGSVIGWRRMRAELPQARKLIRLFEASPMALVAAANRLAIRPHWTIAVLLERLRHREDWLDELVNARVDLVSSIELSCRSLSPTHRDAFFRLAAAADEPLTTRGASALLGCDQRTAEAILESLVEHQLATVAPDTFGGQFHYRFAPLVRVAASSLSQFAAASAPPADANDLWIRRAPSV